MATYFLIVSQRARRFVLHAATPLPRLSPSLFSNSFPHNLLSDSRPLTPVLSIFYENIGKADARYFFKPAIFGLFHSSPFFPIFFTLFWATGSPQLLWHLGGWVPGWVPPFFAKWLTPKICPGLFREAPSDQGFLFHASSARPDRLGVTCRHSLLFLPAAYGP